MATETVEYKVVKTLTEDIEIREYAPHLIAEVTVTGDRDEAASAAFRILAGFIFGDNQSQDKVAMTAPVSQTPSGSQAPTQVKSEKIAMTAPVSQMPVVNDETDAQQTWLINFAMPSEYTLATLPVPNDTRITVRQVEPYQVAVIRFSGRAGMKSLTSHSQELMETLGVQGLSTQGQPTYAFYNAPWTPGFMRRNEVQFRLLD